MAETVKSAVAVVGIDIGKNSFHVVAWIGAAPLCWTEVVAWPS
jgi:hypothetical protein